MRGRDLFEMARWPLGMLTLAFRLMPRPVAKGIWPILDILPGVIGLGFRYALARRLAGAVGTSVYFGPRVSVRAWENFRLGDNVSIHRDCYIDASGGIVIGSDVSIAHASSVISVNHTWDDPSLPIRSNPVVGSSIFIADDVWIACGVRVLAGSNIGKRSVVAAGCVVAGTFEPNALLAGVPAKKIRAIA